MVDPLGAPYALAFQRFCPTRTNFVSDADEYDDAFAKFRLSHTCEVPIPAGGGMDDLVLLTRKQVLLARTVFNHCSENDAFGTDMHTLGNDIKLSIPHTLG